METVAEFIAELIDCVLLKPGTGMLEDSVRPEAATSVGKASSLAASMSAVGRCSGALASIEVMRSASCGE